MCTRFSSNIEIWEKHAYLRVTSERFVVRRTPVYNFEHFLEWVRILFKPDFRAGCNNCLSCVNNCDDQSYLRNLFRNCGQPPSVLLRLVMKTFLGKSYVFTFVYLDPQLVDT